jgi:acetyl esterase/lipase
MKFAALIAAAITIAAHAASAQIPFVPVPNAVQPYQPQPVPGYRPYQAPQVDYSAQNNFGVPRPPPGPVLVVPHGGGYYSFIQ